MTEDLQKDHLDLLLRASALLNSTLSLDGVLAYLLKEAVQIVRAQNGFILLWDGDNWTTKASIPKDSDLVYSRTIVSQVAREQSTICLLNASDDTEYSPTASIKEVNLRSVICSPLLWRGRVRGVIYLDHRVSEGVFQEEQTQLVEALSQQAAVALENAVLHEEQEHVHRKALRKANTELAQTQAQLFNAKELAALVMRSLDGPLEELAGECERLPKEERERLNGPLVRLQKLASDFSAFLKPERSTWRPFRVDKVLNEMLESLPRSETISYRTELFESLVEGDSKAVARAVHELVKNCENALSGVEGKRLIVVSTFTESGNAILEVRDTGVGMEQEELNRAFEPFYSASRSSAGAGLGLSVAKHILDLHGAQITLESTVGEGTRFRAIFPAV